MKTLRMAPILIVVSFIASNALSLDFIGGMVSTDTLYAGQINEIRMNAGLHDAEKAVACMITSEWTEDGDRCPECFLDTICAIDIQTFNDTVVTLTFDIPEKAYPTKWDLDLYNGIDGSMHYNPMHMFTKPYIHTQPENDTSCLGGTASFDVFAYSSESIYYWWFHNGQSVQRLKNEPVLIIEDVTLSDTGMYNCFLESTRYDSVYSDTVYLVLREMPVYQASPEGPEYVSYSDGPLTYRVKPHEQVTAYNWILLPGDAGSIDQPEDTVIQVTWNSSYHGKAGLFVETSLGDCPGLNSDTLWIQVSGKPETPEICVVGLDEATEKCRIVWNPINDPSILTYNIYRESNQAGTFLPLWSINAGEPTVFVDSNSVPTLFPQSYKMSITDTCGNESDLSSVHTTILLSSSPETDGSHFLNWTHYVGAPCLSYNIYNGYRKDSMTLIYTIPSSVNAFMVPDPLPGSVLYQVVAPTADPCNPTLKSSINYSETRSNINLTAVHTDPAKSSFLPVEISPNPASNKVWISYSAGREETLELILLNLLGKVCGNYILPNGQSEIDVSGIEPGMYLIHLKGRDSVYIQKLVIRR